MVIPLSMEITVERWMRNLTVSMQISASDCKYDSNDLARIKTLEQRVVSIGTDVLAVWSPTLCLAGS